jgi:hypothetical protein
MKLPGAYEVMASAAAPAINFTRGILGFQEPFATETMQNRAQDLAASKGVDKGSIGYEDYGLPVSTQGSRFTGGLFDLALKNPIDFGLAGSYGRYSFDKNPESGEFDLDDTKYDFTTTGGNPVLDYINKGGLKAQLLNFINQKDRRFKQQQLMNRRKQDMQQKIRQAEAVQQVQQNIQTYGNRDRPNEGINTPGGGKGQSPTGGDVAGTPFVRGGRASYFDGGLLSLWPR